MEDDPAWCGKPSGLEVTRYMSTRVILSTCPNIEPRSINKWRVCPPYIRPDKHSCDTRAVYLFSTLTTRTFRFIYNLYARAHTDECLLPGKGKHFIFVSVFVLFTCSLVSAKVTKRMRDRRAPDLFFLRLQDKEK